MIDLLNNYSKCIFMSKENKETEKTVKLIIEKIRTDIKDYETGHEYSRFQEANFNKKIKFILNAN